MRRYLLIVPVALLVAGVSAHATTITPGTTVVADSFSAADDVALLAHTSGTWTTPGIGGHGGAMGTFTDAVYSTTTPNELDFVYQFTNSSTSSNSITQTTALSFLGFNPPTTLPLDVGCLTNGSALPGGIFVNGASPCPTAPSPGVPGVPGTISEDGLGSTVTFNFNVTAGENVTPGTTTTVLVVRANAPTFTTGMVGVIAGGTTNLAGYQPMSAIPEPSFLLPLGLGLLAAVVIGRRRVARRA
jgi:hypothetical protein